MNYTSDIKMLYLLGTLKAYGIIRFDTEFCEAVGVLKQNLINIKKGKNHFTPEHIENAIKAYQVNANWIFGVSDKIFLGEKFNPHHKDTSNSTQKDYKPKSETF